MNNLILSLLDIAKRILNYGIDPAMNTNEAYRIRSVNSMCVFCLIISLPFYLIFYNHELFGAFTVIFLAHMCFILVLLFNRANQYSKAKLTLLLVTNGSVLSLSLMFGSASGFHLYIYTASLFVFWLFDNSKVLLIITAFFIYLALMLGVFYFDSIYKPNSVLPSGLLNLSIYQLNAVLSITLVFLLFFNYFKYQNLLVQDLLLKQNNLETEVLKRIDSEEKTRLLLEDLSLSFKNLEQFSFVVSHNMRSPVAHIKSFLTLYDRKSSTSENIKIIEYVENSAVHLDSILNDLNFILKNKNAALENKEVIHFQNLVDSVRSNLSCEIDVTLAKVTTKISGSETIFSIKSTLTSVLYNLIQNALKYRKNWEPPVINISFELVKTFYCIKIQDNGIGIDTVKHKDRLFTLYSRFHRNTEGKGIGLYLVKTHVEMLGGTIQIESEVNVGTTFIIKLPA